MEPQDRRDPRTRPAVVPRIRSTLLIAVLTLLGPLATQAAGAAILIESAIELSLQLTPASGAIVFLDPATLQPRAGLTARAFAQAANSLGEFDQQTDSVDAGVAAAFAAVTWAEAGALANGITLTAAGASTVDIPNCIDAQAASIGRGALFGAFMLIGGIGSTDVEFSLGLSSSQLLAASDCAVFGSSEVIASLELDGTTLPEVFFQSLITVGPGQMVNPPTFATTLQATRGLEFGTVYSLFAEADAESLGVTTVPAPPSGILMLTGLGIYCLRMTRCRFIGTRRRTR